MRRIQIGCDIVSIPRFKKIFKRTPAMRRRIFLPQEEKGRSTESLAGIFAAKEAAIKALEIPGGNWHKIEIHHQKNGKPQIKPLGHGVSKRDKYEVSIAHDGDYALAFVIIH